MRPADPASIAPYLSPIPGGEVARVPGRCRACGCHVLEPCAVLAGQEGQGRPPANLAERYRRSVVRRTCEFVEDDLCSRCHGVGRPTRRQLGELGRIRDRKGEVLVEPGLFEGDLVVRLMRLAGERVESRPALPGRPAPILRVAVPPPTLILSPDGRARPGTSWPETVVETRLAA